MRNRIKILLSIIFLLPIMVFADDKIVQNINPKENIYIASSELIEITPGVEEVSQPTIKDWNIKQKYFKKRLQCYNRTNL